MKWGIYFLKTRINDKDYVVMLTHITKLSKRKDMNIQLVRKTLESVLRDYSYKRPCNYVSEEVVRIAKEKSVALKFDTHGKFRKTALALGVELRWEHSNTINSLVQRLIDGESAEIVLSDNIVSVLTKTQDDKINEEGYRVKREDTFENIYRSLEIKLIDYNDYLKTLE